MILPIFTIALIVAGLTSARPGHGSLTRRDLDTFRHVDGRSVESLGSLLTPKAFNANSLRRRSSSSQRGRNFMSSQKNSIPSILSTRPTRSRSPVDKVEMPPIPVNSNKRQADAAVGSSNTRRPRKAKGERQVDASPGQRGRGRPRKDHVIPLSSRGGNKIKKMTEEHLNLGHLPMAAAQNMHSVQHTGSAQNNQQPQHAGPIQNGQHAQHAGPIQNNPQQPQHGASIQGHHQGQQPARLPWHTPPSGPRDPAISEIYNDWHHSDVYIP